MTTMRLPRALTVSLLLVPALGCPVESEPPADTGADDADEDDGESSDDAASDESSDGPGDTTDSDDTGEPATCPVPTGGPTIHEDDVVGHEVWTAEGSPHVVEWTVDVRGGATLEIEPCAVVQFAEGHGLNVAFPGTPTTGTLIAEGTVEQPIRFEGKDGARWGHVFVQGPGTARLAHVTLEGGGGAHTRAASLVASGDGTYPVQEPLFVDHVTIVGSLGAGVIVDHLARFATGSTDLVVTGSGNDANPYPLVLGEHAIDELPLGDYTGNAVDEILIEPTQTIHEDTTMRNVGVRYVVGNGNDLVVGSGDAEAPATLTIEPGVHVAFAAGTALEVEHYTGEFAASGILVAHGGEGADQIVFTSAAADPQPGDWIGLWFGGIVQPQTALSRVRVEYSGAWCGCILATCSDIDEHEGAVIMSQPPGHVFMTDSVIAHGSMHGFVLGYDGPWMDFRSVNEFESMAGCEATLPREGACPNPLPSCVE